MSVNVRPALSLQAVLDESALEMVPDGDKSIFRHRESIISK